jgi:primosomal protein N' (replication factor Y)
MEIQEFSELTPLTYRISSTAEIEIIGTKADKFKVLTPAAINMIRGALDQGEKIFLFTLRKGLSPFTVCRDCGDTVLCDFCSAPLTLYNRPERGRIFACNRCHKEKKSNLVCLTCGGWNLTTLGIGADLAAEEVAKLFPKADVAVFSREKIKTAKSAHAAMKKFYKSGQILIGTELALFYLDEPVKNSAVISLDSLFSIPNFRINEKIMRLLIDIQSLTLKKMLIQTKNPDEQILKQFQGGQLVGFYRQELEDRKTLNYPPFSRLIKITWGGSKAEMEKIKIKMAEIFNEYNPYVFAAFIHKVKSQYVLNTVLKIGRLLWTLPEISSGGTIDEKLLAQLQSLPPSFSIQVDPDDLL